LNPKPKKKVLLKTSVEVTPDTTFEKGGLFALPFLVVRLSLLTPSLLKCDKIRKMWYNMPNFALEGEDQCVGC
jgi:hypothetical protein